MKSIMDLTYEQLMYRLATLADVMTAIEQLKIAKVMTTEDAIIANSYKKEIEDLIQDLVSRTDTEFTAEDNKELLAFRDKIKGLGDYVANLD